MKKVIALILTALMLTACFAGCGSEKPAEPAETAAPAADAQTEAAAPEAEEAGDPRFPAIGTADKPVHIRILSKEIDFDNEDNIKMMDNVEAAMAAHGQYVEIELLERPAGSYNSALPLAYMNGDVDADLIYFQGGDLAVTNQGLLTDLTPYLENSPFIMDLANEASKERMANYPYLLFPAMPRTNVPVVRKDFAEQCESYEALLADPTVDNYKAFFQELKDKGLCEYPLICCGDTSRIDSIFNHAFGVTGTCLQEDGKWIFSKASQAEKNKLEFYAELYEKGLLNPEYVTLTWDVMEQQLYANKSAVASASISSANTYDIKMRGANGENAVMTALPPAKGVSQAYTSVDVTKETRGLGINIDSEVKDAVWAFLEFMASPEGRMMDLCGVEGVHYNIEDNKIVFTEAHDSWYPRVFDNQLNFEPENPSLAQPVMGSTGTEAAAMYEKYNTADHSLMIPEEMLPMWDAMNNLYNEYSTDIIRGVRTVSDFDEFVEKWNKAGGAAFEELLQTTFG